MTQLLPIIEQLGDARRHEDRAYWLLRCPLDILGRYETTIRNRLMHAGFRAGLDYLDDIRIMKSGVRREDGQMSIGQVDILADAADRLWAGTRGEQGLDAPAPDHSLTEV